MQTTVGKLSITYKDQLEFDTLLQEIFKQRTYYVDLAHNTPVIIDAGAHIGMTTLYLATLYPRAHFICIEPDPTNLPLLAQNLEDNRVSSYEIIPKALVGKKEASIPFYTASNFSVFSSLSPKGWTGEEQTNSVMVETITLSSLLERPVDLVKLDIEGAETAVLREAQHRLSKISHLFVEFHKTKQHPEDLCLRLLQGNFPTVEVSVDPRKERNRANQLLFIEAYR